MNKANGLLVIKLTTEIRFWFLCRVQGGYSRQSIHVINFSVNYINQSPPGFSFVILTAKFYVYLFACLYIFFHLCLYTYLLWTLSYLLKFIVLKSRVPRAHWGTCPKQTVGLPSICPQRWKVIRADGQHLEPQVVIDFLD